MFVGRFLIGLALLIVVTLGATTYTLSGSTLTISGTGNTSQVYCRISSLKSITAVVIESGVTGLGDHAFENCANLKNVTIGDTLDYIGNHVFRGALVITSFNVDSRNPVFSSEDGVLYNKAKTELIRFPGGLSKVTIPVIPSSVTTISSFAFANCSIENITIPSTVSTIEYAAFAQCALLRNFFISGDKFKFENDFLLSGDGKTLYFYPVSLKGVTSVTIPDSVEIILDYAFYKNAKLATLDLKNVKTIGSYAFAECSYLTGELVIPDSVTSVGPYAFSKCKITSVKIGKGLTRVEDYTFSADEQLTSAVLGDNVKSVGSFAFDGCKAMTFEEYENGLYLGTESKKYLILYKAKSNSITYCKVHADTITISAYAFSGVSSLNTLTVSDNVKVIEKNAFQSCGLETITFGSKLERIEEYAFYSISKVAKLVIPDSVTFIGKRAFYGSGLSALTTLELGDHVTTIEEYAFANHRSLKEVDIPNSVETIGAYAFTSAFALKSLKIGKRLSTFEVTAFDSSPELETLKVDSDNSNFKTIDNVLYDKNVNTLLLCAGGKTSVKIEKTVTALGYRSMSRCGYLKKITIPKSVTSVGEEAFTYCTKVEAFDVEEGNSAFKAKNGCLLSKDGTVLVEPPKGKKVVKVPDSVTEITTSKFSSCKCRTVIIGDQVTSIGNNAFYDSAIEEISIGSGLTSIGSQAFVKCANLTKFCYAGKKDLGTSGIFVYATNLGSVTVPLDYQDTKFCTKTVSKEAECHVTGESESDASGIDRIKQLFKVRTPKHPAIIAPFDGTIEFEETPE